MIRPQKIGLLDKLQSSRRQFIHTAIGILFAAIVGVGYFESTSKTDAQFDDKSRTLNRGLIGEPESLDPHQISSDQAAKVLRDTGEGLVSIGANGELTGGVAESWEISSDGLVYRFRLRANAYWSTGRRVTAEDFVKSYWLLVDPNRAAVNVSTLGAVANAESIVDGTLHVSALGVKALRDDLLEVRLKSPQPFFLQLLSHPSLQPILGDAENLQSHPRPSNGAYILEDWTKGAEITLKKNPVYWGASNVYFETVKYHIIQEGTEFNRFRAGELDITSTVASEVFSVARREFPDELKVASRLGVYYYGYNLKNPLFSENRKLRKALSLAIDRKLLVQNILARGEKPAYGWVPPGVSDYETQTLEELEFDKVTRELEAKRLYKAAGYGPSVNLTIQLRYNTSDMQRRIAVAIAAMWHEVLGVETDLVSEEFQVLLANIRDGIETEIFRLSWIANYDDPQTFLELFESDHPQNLTRYQNPEFDMLLRAAHEEANDNVKRKSLLEKAERLALSDYPVIPIYFYVSKHLVSDRIIGWSPNVLDIHLSQHLEASR